MDRQTDGGRRMDVGEGIHKSEIRNMKIFIGTSLIGDCAYLKVV